MATAEDIKFRFTAQDDISKQLKTINTEFQTLSVRSEVAAKSLAKTEKASTSLATTATRLRNNMRGANHSIQQASYQIQDIAVQAEMGVDPLRILGQQGSQLAMALGPQGALVGGVIAVGAALLGTMIPAANDTTEALQDMFDELEKGTEGLTSFTEQQKRLAKALLPDQIQKALQTLMEKREIEEDEIKTLEALRKAEFVSPSAIKAQERVVEIAKIQNETAQERLDLLKNISKEARSAPSGGFSIGQFEDIADVEKEIEEAFTYSDKIIAYNQKIRDEDFAFTQAWRRDQIETDYEERIAAEKKLQDDVRALRSLGLDNQKTDLRSSFVEQLKLVQDLENSKTDIEFNAKKAREQINQRMQQASLQSAQDGLNALAQYNKTAFKAAKAFNIAQAIMNTYTGATKALTGMLPPWSYIAAAGQIAFGMAQVAQIRSQSYSGRAVGGQVSAGTPYMVGEQGREMFVPSVNGQIVKNSDVERMGGSGGVTNINFSITTVDAKGFDELLTSRRGQIVNMVNRAMNDRGRVGVTA